MINGKIYRLPKKSRIDRAAHILGMQGFKHRRRRVRRELGSLACEDEVRQAELPQHGANGGTAEPGSERELQPARQPGILRHAGGVAWVRATR